MGLLKRYLMKQQEEGWRSVGDKYVCAKCVDETAIKKFIKSNCVKKYCSYCKRPNRKVFAAEMDSVLEFIAAGVNSEYEDPANGVGYDSSEGGYQLSTMDSDDLVQEMELGDSNENFIDDVRTAFSDQLWIEKNPYSDRLSDALRSSWDSFSKQVKHYSRFVFFRLKMPDLETWEEEPHRILKSLHSIVEELSLVTQVKRKSSFYRAHRHKPTELLSGAKRLGTPPADKASHSRMSPAGIPMLYVAKEISTAVAETPLLDSQQTSVTVAEFVNKRTLFILDLSNIPNVPSLFDEDKRHQRMSIIFLQRFAEDISKPISDNEKAYEYVPTQVLTEYFKLLFRKEDGKSLDGIAFSSSKVKGGVNFTLFFTQAQCAERETDNKAEMVLVSTH